MRDIHNNVKSVRVIAPVAVGTTGTGQTGKIIDTAGYNGVEFFVSYGTITATNATLTVTVKDGDVTGTLASVADAYLLGTEALAGIGATGTRTSAVSKLITKRLGYIGSKRYVNCSVKSTITAGTLVSVVGVVGEPNSAPVGAGT